MAPPKNIEILGTSQAIKKVKSDILKVQGSDAFVLITGETGTGKEVIARNLHAQEKGSNRPFMAVNCANIIPSLFESDFFIKLQVANGGDFFLDEISSLSRELQAKLSVILKHMVIVPSNSNKELPLNMRFISSTNIDIEEEVAQGRFREDLYYQLSQFTIHSPALRDRRDDILMLAEFFLKEDLPLFKFSEESKKALLSHAWIGNIRELQNTVGRASINARGAENSIITMEHLIFISPKKTNL